MTESSDVPATTSRPSPENRRDHIYMIGRLPDEQCARALIIDKENILRNESYPNLAVAGGLVVEKSPALSDPNHLRDLWMQDKLGYVSSCKRGGDYLDSMSHR